MNPFLSPDKIQISPLGLWDLRFLSLPLLYPQGLQYPLRARPHPSLVLFAFWPLKGTTTVVYPETNLPYKMQICW